ncbi:hypothetical protein EV651_111168 [Kribbella sp. VKM Ac-2571]|uniref:hypothetical protein n=1 Tax=Kribbella sp. VKM Ac-2571 TaxID=2512222 RepID=UPI00105D90F1|nr:hypothetical protein [Kribbella sp. VKM Ac-2571]TDO57442.1 hypothetical protein EV651_111168 [Kribbella sp. VKM Ac-2571]
MSEPTPAPDAVDPADASYWQRQNLEDLLRDSEPLREDESFEIPDLADDEWDRFVRAIHE